MVVVIGRFFIMLVSTGIAYYVLVYHFSTTLHEYAIPILVVAVCSYSTANVFCQVLSMTADTILQCFVADEEISKSGLQPFAEHSLKQWMIENHELIRRDVPEPPKNENELPPKK